MKNIKNTYLFIILFVFIQLMGFAQDANVLFVTANQLYQQEKYHQAIEKFHQLEKQEVQSAELFYNLANAYYKINKVAPSIYYYEKALQLTSNNKDILFNLNFAKRMTIDNIEELPTTIFQKLSKNYIQKLSYNSWSYLVILFVVLFAILFLMYHFSFSTTKKECFLWQVI